MRYAILALCALLTSCGGSSDTSPHAGATKAVYGPQLRPCEAPEAPCPVKP
jgi:hypothetical protein